MSSPPPIAAPLHIAAPRRPQPQQQPRQQESAGGNNHTHTHTHTHAHTHAHTHHSPARSSSPVAPAYSPITPKARPVLPAPTAAPACVPPENGCRFTFTAPEAPAPPQHQPPAPTPPPVPAQPPAQQPAPPAAYIPQPPNLPFSSEDSSDAVALRAAISALQFQKQKAQDDLQTLAKVKQLALGDPTHFTQELAAGRLKEQRPKLGDLQTILDAAEDGDSDDDAVLGASAEDQYTTSAPRDASPSAEVPGSLPAPPQPGAPVHAPRFPRIPGPQDVVRMPYVNWQKYGVVGGALETMHEQQRKWPGSTQGYGISRGREHAVAAPYSPFHDHIDPRPRDGERKDSGGPRPSLTGTVSEHIMSTRSRDL